MGLFRTFVESAEGVNKKYIGSFRGLRIYLVDDFAIRNLGFKDEEFTDSANHEDFPNLVPKGEIWVSKRLSPTERSLHIYTSWSILDLIRKGYSKDDAYDIAIRIERAEREKRTGVQTSEMEKEKVHSLLRDKFMEIPDPEETINVWLVDGDQIRNFLKTDYTEGGHGYVYPWCPNNAIIIEETLSLNEIPYILIHEYSEMVLMRDFGLDYDKAHQIASTIELDHRKKKGSPLVSKGLPLQLKDLSKAATEEYRSYLSRMSATV